MSLRPILVVLAVLVKGQLTMDLPGQIVTSSEPSGAQCGEGQSVRCLTEATCTASGTCACPAGHYGRGDFRCYHTETVRAEVSGPQNTLTTLDNSTTELLWPCRFRLAQFMTMGATSGQKCHFQVFGLSRIVSGRIAVVGMEVHFGLENESGVLFGLGHRTLGTAHDGLYTYRQWGKSEFVIEDPVTSVGVDETLSFDGSGSGDGSDASFSDDESDDGWGDPSDDVSVVSEVDADNFAVFTVDSCGVDVRLRAPSVEVSQQSQTPGLSMTVDENNGPIQFLGSTTYLATLFVDREGHDVLHTSMAYAARQYQTPEGDECTDTAHIYRTYCVSEQAKSTALTTCSFMLKNAQLVNCLESGNSDVSVPSLEVFKLCLWNSCSPSSILCSRMIDRVQQAGCMNYLPQQFTASLSCLT